MTSFPHLRPAEPCHEPVPQGCHGAGALPRSADFSGYQCETSCPLHPCCGPAVPLWAEKNSQHPLHVPPLATMTDTCQPLVPSLFKKDEKRNLCGTALSGDEKKGASMKGLGDRNKTIFCKGTRVHLGLLIYMPLEIGVCGGSYEQLFFFYPGLSALPRGFPDPSLNRLPEEPSMRPQKTKR